MKGTKIILIALISILTLGCDLFIAPKNQLGTAPIVIDGYVSSLPLWDAGSFAMLVKTATAIPSAYALIKFDLTGIPADAHVDAAFLTLQATAVAQPGTIEARRILQNWVGPVNWATVTVPGFVDIEAVQRSITAPGSYSLNVTSFVGAWRDWANNYGIRLGAPNDCEVLFATSESATPPELVIAYH
jgi:hypothetical protein